jgi:hypothetical protein
MGSTSTPGGPNRSNPAISKTAAPRVFKAKTDTLEEFEEVGFVVQTNVSVGAENACFVIGAILLLENRTFTKTGSGQT